jgi:hypothetical protein
MLPDFRLALDDRTTDDSTRADDDGVADVGVMLNDCAG